MPIQLIILDFDGTLADTRDNIVRTLQASMHQLDLPVADEAACASTIGLKLDDACRHLYPDGPADLADRFVETYREIFFRNKESLVPAPFPHVLPTLRQLRERGVVLTIASSRGTGSLHAFIDAMGLRDCISYVLGADSVEHTKPHPEPVLRTLCETGIDAVHTLVVGDMPVDILMGRNAGVQTCGVTYGNATRDQLQAAGADFLIDDFAELLCGISK
ncbi:phosphoglycolate phosphatase [Tannerella sp. oral taxon BU063 isolate Cell 6/7/9]|uniref:Phosphoglycolate phosphatase n=1 Tax=Tannerella sp. oral taxon BU063 isolate Cell 6/7/9 TaxID=1411021 RepID=W2CT84_9BACT|nr:phosphoglycolate phosphatase [Tannerella sp. oral taxon BU063 isolate Cell 6/7/9]